MKIAAGIVLYNPNIEILKKNVGSIYNQVEKIVFIDNCSENVKEIDAFFEKNSKFCIVHNKENLGVAKALNQICEWAVENGFLWVLTLDQDSISPDNIIEVFRAYLNKDSGILCPVIWHQGEKYMPYTTGKTQNIKACISSGSLMNLYVWSLVGGLDENMFIDLVDTEYCYRVRKAGYNIMRINNVIMHQQLGKNLKVYYFGRKKKFFVTNHPPVRCFYVGRNCIYIIKKHGIHDFFFYSLKALSMKILGIVFFEGEKLNKLKNLFRGLLAGIELEVV